MTRWRRWLLALGIIAVAVPVALAWYAFGAWPVPSGYSFPRHSMFGGPDALYVGTLEDVDGCIRTAEYGSFAVVWPPGSRLEHRGWRASRARRLSTGGDGRAGTDGRRVLRGRPAATRSARRGQLRAALLPFDRAHRLMAGGESGRSSSRLTDPGQGADSSLSWRSMSGCWLTLIRPSCGRSRSMTSQRTAPSATTSTATMTGLRRLSIPAL